MESNKLVINALLVQLKKEHGAYIKHSEKEIQQQYDLLITQKNKNAAALAIDALTEHLKALGCSESVNEDYFIQSSYDSLEQTKRFYHDRSEKAKSTDMVEA